MNFKKWFIINEGKEEKELARKLAGSDSVLSSLNEVIPQNKKDTDKLSLLAAYYYSKKRNVFNRTKTVEQIKTDMKDYIGFLKTNRMPLITVDLTTKEPPSPWKDYLYWTQVIHGHQGEYKYRTRSAFRPSDMDFENETPFLKSQDGKIKVYKGHSPQQCIILGKGQSFCISQPGNTYWQSYRDTQVSTFYFVYDETRDDRLSIVVVDVRPYGIVLTDKVNKTGTTLDPYTNQLTTFSYPYMDYLSEKGIDVSKIVNIPQSDEEKAEYAKLGSQKENLGWFKSLSYEEKSKYIGRGHRLTDQQFDYLWENNFNSLLSQYVKIGLKLNDYQIDKIKTKRDLKDDYLHNRLLADEETKDLSKKEFDLLNDKQKKEFLSSLSNSIRVGMLEQVKKFVDKGWNAQDEDLEYAASNGHLDIIKYFAGEKVELNGEIIKLPDRIDPYISSLVIDKAAENGHLDIVKYLVERGKRITGNAVVNATRNGHFDVVKYLVEKNAYIDPLAEYIALKNGYPDISAYLRKAETRRRRRKQFDSWLLYFKKLMNFRGKNQ